MVNYQESFVWKLLLRTQKVVLLICNILMVIIIAAEVVLRYFFKADLLGYEEIIIILAMWLYFIGGSYASYTKSHINAEVVTLFLKIKLQKIIRLVASIITTIVAITFAFWGYEFFIWALEKRALTTGLRIPVLFSQSALFFGYLMMALYSLVYTIEEIFLFSMWNKNNIKEGRI